MDIIPGTKVTLLPFAHTDIEYFMSIFKGLNCLQFPKLSKNWGYDEFFKTFTEILGRSETRGFTAVKNSKSGLLKFGCCFILTLGHISILRFIMDESMLVGLSKKLSETREWKKVTEQEYQAAPETERRIKKIMRSGKPDREIYLVKRKKEELKTPEERTISEDIIITMTEYCFNTLKSERVETVISPQEKSKGILFGQSGFEKEGVLRKYIQIEDTFHDLVMMSKIRGGG